MFFSFHPHGPPLGARVEHTSNKQVGAPAIQPSTRAILKVLLSGLFVV